MFYPEAVLAVWNKRAENFFCAHCERKNSKMFFTWNNSTRIFEEAILAQLLRYISATENKRSIAGIMSFTVRPSTPKVFMNAFTLQTLIINEKFNFLMDRY